MNYKRITSDNLPLSVIKNIPHEEFYYRLMLLEDEIQNNTIQYRQKNVEPIRVNYSHGEFHYFICKECRFKLPMRYKRFCPNCGVRLREPEASMDKVFYGTEDANESTVQKRNSILTIKIGGDLW